MHFDISASVPTINDILQSDSSVQRPLVHNGLSINHLNSVINRGMVAQAGRFFKSGLLQKTRFLRVLIGEGVVRPPRTRMSLRTDGCHANKNGSGQHRDGVLHFNFIYSQRP